MSSQNGRVALVLLLVALVGGLLVYFLVGNPFASNGNLDRAQEEGTEYDLMEADGSAAKETEPEALTSGLAGRYAESDLGAVRLRLLDVAHQTPLPGEELLLFSRTGGEFKAITSEGGVAVFERLAPSRGYRLEIVVEGQAPVTIQGVRVEQGKVNDLGDILLGQNVVVRGRVVDSTGRPLPGSSISVYTPARSMISQGFMASMTSQVTSFPSPVEQALTDDDGWFALTALTAGSYRLEARRGGYATAFQSDVVVSPSRAARDLTIVLGEGATVSGHVRDALGKPIVDARVVAVRDAGRRFFGSTTVQRDVAVTDGKGAYVIDTLAVGNTYRFGVIADEYAPIFELNGVELESKQMVKDFELALGGTITGRVVNKEDGEPLSDVSVLVAAGSMPFGGRSRGANAGDRRMATARTKTDADGNFRIENVLPGPVISAQVKAPGYVPYTAAMFMGASWGNIVAGEVLEVAVVELLRGGILEGTIKDAATGVVIAGAEVMIMPSEREWQVFMSGSPQAITDSEGRYELVGVAPGSYHVVGSARGYATSDPSGGGADPVVVPNEGGVVTRDVQLTMAGYVTGVITDSVGEPVGGARVRTRVAPAPAAEGGRRGGGRMSRMRRFLPGATGADLTDQNGRYRIDGVSSEDRWIVVAEADDYVESESQPFQIRAGEKREVDVQLVGGGRIEGRVIDERGGFVEGARVRVGRLPTDRAGRGRLNAWEVDRYLEPNVYFTNEDGKFVAENVPPGLALVKVEKEGYVTFYKRNLTIRADETVENYTVSMTQGDVMEGVVRGANGEPIEGAMVAVTKSETPGGEDETETEEEVSEDIEPRLSGRTDANGKFRIENITPGVVNVVVWFAPGHQGWRRGENEKAIRRGIATDATTVEFRLEVSEQGSGLGPPRGR